MSYHLSAPPSGTGGTGTGGTGAQVQTKPLTVVEDGDAEGAGVDKRSFVIQLPQFSNKYGPMK